MPPYPAFIWVSGIRTPVGPHVCAASIYQLSCLPNPQNILLIAYSGEKMLMPADVTLCFLCRSLGGFPATGTCFPLCGDSAMPLKGSPRRTRHFTVTIVDQAHHRVNGPEDTHVASPIQQDKDAHPLRSPTDPRGMGCVKGLLL